MKPRSPEAAVPLVEAVDHVYVHVPFCASKCPYCDFNSHAGRDDEADPYLDALREEARRRVAGTRPRTLFVGGGTPTHLDAGRLERYLGGLREVLGAGDVAEFTVECNPGSLNRAKVRALRSAGVNRVSLGVQSFHDRHLKTLGRIHGAADAVRSVELLREGGIPRISVDLILAVPGQTIAEQERDVARAVDLDPEHVSAYVLTFEEGTAFARMLADGRFEAPEEERELLHLHAVGARLAEAGYRRYEISNFARPGAECAHNVAYWQSADWIGLGAGAHSHRGRVRWKNVDDPAEYTTRMRASGDAVEWREEGTPRVALFETLMMGLRLVEGIEIDRVRRLTGLDPVTVHGEILQRHVAEGLLTEEDGRLRLTARGLDLASYVVRSLLPEPA
jgi:oxygen-independent coproporphyrinogen-3 oxidase